MMESALHALPRPGAVWRAQLRAVGYGLRREALIAGAVLAVTLIAVVAEVLRGDEVVHFRPQQWLIPGLLGLLLPVAVWKGGERLEGALIWTLPVERGWHALARVLAGWVWLMSAVAVFVLCLLLLTLLSGGGILAEETLWLWPASMQLPTTSVVWLEPGVLQSVEWRPSRVLWMVPFTAATATYLLASALMLGPRRPLRWLAGALLFFFLLAGAADLIGNLAESEWLVFAPSRFISAIWNGRYGIQMLLMARTDLHNIAVMMPTHEMVSARTALPDAGHWAAATLIWSAAGVLALAGATVRLRERRRR